MEHLSAKDAVLNLAGVSPRSGVVHQEVKMELQEVILDKEVFHEELRILKMKVDKLEELQPRDTGDLSGTEGQ